METRLEKRFLVLLTVVGMVLMGCGGGGKEEHKAPGAMTKAIAVLHPTEGSKVHGVIAFSKGEKGIRIRAGIEGLDPGMHGFHIHEYGDCSSPDATSAGGHFNPGDMPHASPIADKHHVGDMGNIEADGTGLARLDQLDPHMTFQGPNSIIGRAVIVHASQDDLTTQPTGNAGPRVACGVIGFAK